eukprot:TRINITY_DN6399_c0_g1_i2.p1 TRINITY_DN6399_c0_g1~~TRINITY_DN6399_c0_g1_i2.p1  ORF type:complete len:310 (+),score=32.35 TRINITY_DN6399_c0_g1_i2:72-1001(+)
MNVTSKISRAARLCNCLPAASRRSKTTFPTRKSLTMRPAADVLRLATFNVLAPCHKRVGRGLRESAFDTICMDRQQQIIQLTLKYAPTIFCLQEFWFDTAVRELYRQQLHSNYATISLKRPGRRQDGLLMGYNPRLATLHRQDYVTHEQAGRVSLLAHFTVALRHAAPMDVIVANTHLNFPHREAEEPVREGQARELLTAVASFGQGIENVLLMGDFNGTLDSSPCQIIQNDGYASSYGLVHAHEPHVTHRNHLGEQVGVDFIFTKGLARYQPWAATVLPEHASDEAWPQGFTLSDHRPVLVDFKAAPL